TATYEDIIYTVSVISSGHGAAIASRSSGVYGSYINLTATPNKGYRLARWEVISGGVQVFQLGDKDFIQIGTENVVVKAIFEKIVYTVTLSPGEGTGDEIVFSSAAQTEIPTINNAKNNMFYLETDGSMGFKFDSYSCPEGWSAPDGKVFVGFFDTVDYTVLKQENTVFTAQWNFVGGINMTSDVTLDFDSIDADGFLPITLDVYNINFGNDLGKANLDVYFPSGALTDGNNHALPFDVYTADHSRTLERIQFEPDKIPCSCCLTLKFDPAALADAEYGEYHCTWSCALQWNETDGILPETTEISLHMTKQDQNAYSVTVTSEGSGTAYASTDSGTSGTEVTLTATPDEGWYFRKWQVVSGNVSLTGNKFCIHHADVEIKAVFEEIATHTHSVTVTNTEGGTAQASAASGTYGTQITLTAKPDFGFALKEWQVVSGGVTVTHNTFTIGDDDVEIRAVFAQEPTYTLELPQSVTVTPGAVFTPVTGTVTELSMITGVNGKTPERLRIAFGAGTLTHQQDSSKTLAFESVFDSVHVPNENIVNFTSPGSKTSYLRIAGDRWSTAAPGTYTGSIPYRVFWFYNDHSTSNTLESGTIPVTVTIPAPGDVDSDGEVDLADVTLLSRYLAGGWNVTVDETVADVNKDGIIDLKDVVLIRRYLAGGWNVALV
ncbi:MAG: dockerin type I repeat-containing protein, partial [Clostridia bacterium]|nr:dockerin type I repeat-containing protein [Clostridia bacterium]